VDILTASTLRSVLDALFSDGHLVVGLDFAQLSYIGAAGIAVIGGAAHQLALLGGAITVHSPSRVTRRALELTGLSGLLEGAGQGDGATLAAARAHSLLMPVGHSALGTEQRNGDLSIGVARRAAAPLPGFTWASLRAGTEVVDAALQLVTVLASATIGGADGVSVSLERAKRISTVAFSDETILRMDHHQYETDQGPCLAAAREARWFHIDSLADETRWPDFVPLALGEGIGSILSTPLMLADTSVGALNIYSRANGAFGPDQQELAALFATQASGILDVASVDDRLAQGVGEALAARAVIAQAQGVLMARQHISADRAAGALFRTARAAETSVLRRAAEVVASTSETAVGSS
jgi:anti-anti-sigma factor